MNPPVATQLALKITTKPCDSLCFAPDGNVFAHAAMDGAAPYFTIWDVNAARALTRIDSPHNVFLQGFSADGQTLATTRPSGSTGWTNGFQLWHVLAGVELPTVPCDYLVACMSFAGNGVMAAGGIRMPEGLSSVSEIPSLPSAEGVIQVWPSVRGGSSINLVGHTHMVARMAFSRNCRWLASCDIKGNIHVWDLHSGQPVATSRERTCVADVTFADGDETLIVIGGETASTWRWASVESPKTVRVGYLGTLGSSLLNDGCHLAAQGRDGDYLLWNARTGTLVDAICSIPVPAGQYPVFQSAAAVTVPRLAVSFALGETGSIIFFDLHLPPVTTTPAFSLNECEVTRMTCHGWVSSVSLAPDNRSCASAAQCEVQMWALPEGRREARSLLEDRVCRVRHSPAGDRLAAVDCKGQVRVWDLQQMNEVARWESGIKEAALLVFSPDGKLLALTGGIDDNERLVVHETASGRRVAEQHEKRHVRMLAFLPMPGGWRLLRILTNASFHEASCVIEPLQGDGRKQRFALKDSSQEESIYCMEAVLLPDKGILAAYDEVFNCVHFYDIASGGYLRNTPISQLRVRTISASPGGDVIALAGGWMAFMKREHDHSIHLLDTTSGREFARRTGHTDVVNEVAMSGSEEFMLSGSADLTVRLWKTRP